MQRELTRTVAGSLLAPNFPRQVRRRLSIPYPFSKVCTTMDAVYGLGTRHRRSMEKLGSLTRL